MPHGSVAVVLADTLAVLERTAAVHLVSWRLDGERRSSLEWMEHAALEMCSV